MNRKTELLPNNALILTESYLMQNDAVFGLASNLGILALCTLLVTLILDFQNDGKLFFHGSESRSFLNRASILIGVVFGVTCAILLLSAEQTSSGSVIDTRAAPAILSGILGGPLGAIITAIFGTAARFSIGGPFVIGGSISVGIYTLSGLVLGRWLNIELGKRDGSPMFRLAVLALLCTVLIVPTFFVDQDLLTSRIAIETVMPALLAQNLLGVLLLGGAFNLALRSTADRHALNIAMDKLKFEKEKAGKERSRLMNAIEALPEAFVIYDAEDRLVICNTRYKETYEKSSKSIKEGVKFEEILRTGLANGQYPEAHGREEEWLKERLNRHCDPQEPIEQKVAGNITLQIHEKRTADGEIVGFRTDISALKRQQQILERQAEKLLRQASYLKKQKDALTNAKNQSDRASVTDQLTGLGNRRGLNKKLPEMIKNLSSGSNLFVMILDLDHFKSINDMYGHTAGDHALKWMAQILNNRIDNNYYLARIGGDEFVALMSSEKREENIGEIANDIISACNQPLEHDGRELRFSVSIGIAVTNGENADTVIADADIALYQAKLSGRHQYKFFTREMRVYAEERKRMADDLIKALAENQIQPYFQPQVSASGRALVGVEALARWKHPIRGSVPPDVFIPLAADLGLLDQIDDCILRESIAMVRRLHASGNKIPRISVNLSCKHMDRVKLEKTLADLKPWPCKIAFELLETIDYDLEFEKFDSMLTSLREQSIEIDLDDFGSGRASITTLLKLRPDRIKLDKKLVDSLPDKLGSLNPMVKAITDMGLGLKIPMIAEGVETEEQAAILSKIGYDYLQGYLISPALPEEKINVWISENEARYIDRNNQL